MAHMDIEEKKRAQLPQSKPKGNSTLQSERIECERQCAETM